MRPAKLVPIGAHECRFDGSTLRVQARMPERHRQFRLVRIAVEVLPAVAVPSSTSARGAIEVRRSPAVAILFDTDQGVVPKQVSILRRDYTITHQRWGADVRVSGNETVLAEYELHKPLPAGTTAAAVFIFEVPE